MEAERTPARVRSLDKARHAACLLSVAHTSAMTPRGPDQNVTNFRWLSRARSCFAVSSWQSRHRWFRGCSKHCAVGYTRLATITTDNLMQSNGAAARRRGIRPDWKIDTPEMRERWDHRDRNAFFPCGKTLKQVLVRMSNAVDQFE
jgi:hypothetical protein